MKSIFKVLSIAFGFLFLLILPMFSQETEIPPETVYEALDLQKWLMTFSLLVACSTFLTIWVNGFLKIEKSFWRKFMGWFVVAVLTLAGKFLVIGFVAVLSWPMIAVTVALGGLGANGLFDVPLLQQAWYFLESLTGSPKAIEKLK